MPSPSLVPSATGFISGGRATFHLRCLGFHSKTLAPFPSKYSRALNTVTPATAPPSEPRQFSSSTPTHSSSRLSPFLATSDSNSLAPGARKAISLHNGSPRYPISVRLMSTKREDDYVCNSQNHHEREEPVRANQQVPKLRDDQFEASPGPQPAHAPLEHQDDIPDIIKQVRLGLGDRHIAEDDLWHLYQRIPEPRAQHAPDICRDMLWRLKVVRHATPSRMLRYLTVISDLISVGLYPQPTAWPAAMHFAGRSLTRLHNAEVDSMFRVWRQMEQDAGVESNIVCFNILFDVATKTHKFLVTDAILAEMAHRGIEYNRHFRTSLIYHWGVRGNGDMVRKHYENLVEAGEIVDTAVINCVIGALLGCGEPTSAEYMLLNANSLQESRTTPQQATPRHWYRKRELGKELEKATRTYQRINDKDSELKAKQARIVEQLRQSISLAPDETTYRLLIHYYAVQVGNIERVAQLIDEMDKHNVPVQGSIYLWLFYAFAKHGGTYHTQWTRARLERTWTAFLDAVDETLASQQEKGIPTSQAARHPMEHSSQDASEGFFAQNDHVERWEQHRDGLGEGHTALASANAQKNHHLSDELDPVHEASAEDPTRTDEQAEVFGFPEEEIIPPIFVHGIYRGFMEDSEPRGVYVGRVMALRIGLAFAKCTHVSRTAQIWLQLKKRWRPEFAEDVPEVEEELAQRFGNNAETFQWLVSR